MRTARPLPTKRRHIFDDAPLHFEQLRKITVLTVYKCHKESFANTFQCLLCSRMQVGGGVLGLMERRKGSSPYEQEHCALQTWSAPLKPNKCGLTRELRECKKGDADVFE